MSESYHLQHIAVHGGRQEAHLAGYHLGQLSSGQDQLGQLVHLGIQLWGREEEGGEEGRGGGIREGGRRGGREEA